MFHSYVKETLDNGFLQHLKNKSKILQKQWFLHYTDVFRVFCLTVVLPDLKP